MHGRSMPLLHTCGYVKSTDDDESGIPNLQTKQTIALIIDVQDFIKFNYCILKGLHSSPSLHYIIHKSIAINIYSIIQDVVAVVEVQRR